MKFSIVVPLYNKSRYIGKTIDSVLYQTYKDFELIIVDDSSSDNSVEIVNSYSDQRIKLYTKPNGGVSKARNYGIEKATGEVVCFLDADDIWDRNYLLELSHTISSFPECGFFCGAYKIFSEEPSSIIGVRDLSRFDARKTFVVDFLKMSVKIFGIIALTSAVSVKSEVLRKMDYWFDENVCRGEDNDMWVRIALTTPTVYSNNPLMLYRADANESLMNRKYNFSYSFKYWKWYDYGENKSLSKLATQRLYSLAQYCQKQGLYPESWYCLSHIKYSYLLGHRILLSSVVLYHLLYLHIAHWLKIK